MSYVELHCHSAYSFLDGASHPEELAARAAGLGYEALALTDHDGVYGSLEFAYAAKAFGVRPITGAEVTLADGSHVTLLVETPGLLEPLPAADGGARRHPAQGTELLPPSLDRHLFAKYNEGLICLSGCARLGLGTRNPNGAAELAAVFGRDRFFVELQRPYERGDAQRNARLRNLAETIGVQTIATGDVHAHVRNGLCSRTRWWRSSTAPRSKAPSASGGNHESVLLAPEAAAERFPDDLDAVKRTVELAERLEFDLTEELGYRYPDFSDRDEPAIAQLTGVCNHAFEARYSGANGHKRKARARLDEELALIGDLGLAGFFLLHWEVLELAKEVAREVRGRVAAPCPAARSRPGQLGRLDRLLPDRPLARGSRHRRPVARQVHQPRAGVGARHRPRLPRDIREKLIVAVTERYGHEHASLVASFSTYRSRGAIRDLGKALGLPFAELERLARVTEGNPKRVAQEIGLLPDGEARLRSPAGAHWPSSQPRSPASAAHLAAPGRDGHLDRPLIELVPVQPAAMAGRQICQWDKDSCADAGFLKIDLLGLGMLSAVEDCVVQIADRRGETIDLSRIPLDDPAVYEEIQRADTIGTFQIESRAQMQSLLRTRPESIDDLTVQVALVRPGPIQGKAVHPYIEHRQKLREDPSFVPPVDHPSLAEPLRETLGVVVFQDQVLEVAMALAGFSVGEAEGLRRAMSRKRSEAAIEAFRERFIEGAAAKGVGAELANHVYDKLVGFSGFGFPKSHAAAFGLLAYQSAWLRHYPAEFLCALLNEQPMGFYPPASLVRDAQRRDVEVRPPHLNRSEAKPRSRTVRCGSASSTWKASATTRQRSWRRNGLETAPSARSSSSPSAALARRAREPDRFRGVRSLGERRTLLWELGLVPRSQSVPGSGGEERQLALPLDPTADTPHLRTQTEWERMLADYRRTSLSVGTHPMQLLRPHLPQGVLSSHDLCQARTGLRWSWRGWPSLGSGPRPRKVSSSCSSRTSSARST